ncbi:Aste57867_21774 [Aphanomyces stellatus]|uniref:Aste57867_21774 protein n=1 Tax=Aphanomyces stellatus TaxID=120398 RepID=A0A485LJ38_9STRA|nr:hypothetical protein As57867_021705 [Aphanomyces stellatus]VFT98443.1 Aste57867_21774 [Aphanomyces stellatus]
MNDVKASFQLHLVTATLRGLKPPPSLTLGSFCSPSDRILHDGASANHIALLTMTKNDHLSYDATFASADCTGGVVLARSTSAQPSNDVENEAVVCVHGTETGVAGAWSSSIPPPDYVPFGIYMDVTWTSTGVTQRILQQTCLATSLDTFGYADCTNAPRMYKTYLDANCTIEAWTEPPPTSLRCVLPNAFDDTEAMAQSGFSSSIAPKYLIKYDHADCTGAIVYLYNLAGVLAADEDVTSCKDGFEVTESAPTSDQFHPGHVYMSVTNPYMLFSGSVLERACVSYEPGKYVWADCMTQTTSFFTDRDCLIPDTDVLYPPKVWGAHCSVLNQSSVLGHAGLSTSAILSTILLVLLVGCGVAALALWRRSKQAALRLGETKTLLQDMNCDADDREDAV